MIGCASDDGSHSLRRVVVMVAFLYQIKVCSNEKFDTGGQTLRGELVFAKQKKKKING